MSELTCTVISLSDDFLVVKKIAEDSFSTTDDSSLGEWFSFSEMEKNILSGKGVCVKAVRESEIVGMIYAQQADLINGKEGVEKWVIIIAAVKPGVTGGGVGSALLKEVEKQVKQHGALKMFTYTNKADKQVINFYEKNGYEDAGWIRDYQYGTGNSAQFLLKYL